MLSIPDRQLPLQNYGKLNFVQPTAQGQLLGSIGKGRYDVKVVDSGMSAIGRQLAKADLTDEFRIGGRKYRDAVSARYANGGIRHIHDRSFVTNCPGDDGRRVVGIGGM